MQNYPACKELRHRQNDKCIYLLNPLLANGSFCHLPIMINFAKKFGPRSGLAKHLAGPNGLTLMVY